MYSGHDSAYVGGYTPAAGKTIMDGVDGATNGTGLGGSYFTLSTTEGPGVNNIVNDTWEYLTITNFSTTVNSTNVLGETNGGGSGSPAVGEVYKYDTIGPNLYGFQGGGIPPKYGQNSGAGYAMSGGSNTTAEYDCFTQNGQGSYNIGESVNVVLANNEMAR